MKIKTQDLTVKAEPAWPNDAPGTLRLTARCGDTVLFAEMGVPADSHGEYARWAEWNGHPPVEGLQQAIERLVDNIQS